MSFLSRRCERPAHEVVGNRLRGIERPGRLAEAGTGLEPDAHVDLEIRATAVGQMIEPDLPKSAPRRKRTVPSVAAAGAAETAGRPKR